MKYRMFCLLFFVCISFPEKIGICMGPASCWNPLSSEYTYFGDSLPSFGFSGGPYRIHSDSAYVSSFWTKVNECKANYSQYSYSTNSAYRCPYYNSTVEGAVPHSIHLYGNAGDFGISNPSDRLAEWRAYRTFDYGEAKTSPYPYFHVDDGLK